jgi:F0F1-type ATP synthase membrane subunit b/b'
MEKVWDELKRIELQAEAIRSEALNKSTLIINLAKKDGEQLVTKARTYAEEDSQQFYDNSLQEAGTVYEEKLKASEEVGKKLLLQAEKHVEQCVEIIVKAVIGESNLAASDKIR